jgi:hypothetical protein
MVQLHYLGGHLVGVSDLIRVQSKYLPSVRIHAGARKVAEGLHAREPVLLVDGCLGYNGVVVANVRLDKMLAVKVFQRAKLKEIKQRHGQLRHGQLLHLPVHALLGARHPVLQVKLHAQVRLEAVIIHPVAG